MPPNICDCEIAKKKTWLNRRLLKRRRKKHCEKPKCAAQALKKALGLANKQENSSQEIDELERHVAES
jgi:hypothetical protein